MLVVKIKWQQPMGDLIILNIKKQKYNCKRDFLNDYEKNKLERNSVLLYTGQKRIADIIAKDSS